jgi:hypothetical protein
MIINGIDPNDLGDDFSVSDSGKVLILDGDGPAYVAAATVKTVPTGCRRFASSVLTATFLAECSTADVYLTAEDSYKHGRFTINAWKPYQGQRSSASKPPLLTPLREALEAEEQHPEFTVHMERILEADDAMMIQAYAEKENGIIRSEDKDLRMTPYPYFDIETGKVMPSDPFGYLYMSMTEGGTKKLLGRSLKFFWAQMVMGDTADNIRGLDKYKGKNIGPVDTHAWLEPIKDIEALCNEVIGAYREINQNPLPEAWLLWLLRSPTDNVWSYFNELPWTEANRAFLAECATRPWFNAGGS